jgi:dihydrofolate synthase / folylpolyglutamate synthase
MSLLEEFKDSVPHEWRLMKPGLERISLACERLGHPERLFPSLHIAGTNGKGSVAAMLHSILSEAGLKVGLFTSPHLVRVNERFRVGNEEISDGELEGFLGEIVGARFPRPGQGDPAPTFFELCTLIAFLYFAESQVDLAILETGLGGRLDATNVVIPLISVITEISLDHTEILGPDLSSIAREKAGIVKCGVPVVCGATAEEARRVIEKTASERGAPLFWADQFPSLKDLKIALHGSHQTHNAAIALKTLEVLERSAGAIHKSPLRIPESAIREGLARVRWPGRVEWVRREPPVLLDGAHNPAGIRALVDYLKGPEAKGLKWTALFSAAKDKAVDEMLRILGEGTDEIIVCRMGNSRSISAERSAVDVFSEKIRDLKSGEGLVVTGSLYLVGEIKALLGG